MPITLDTSGSTIEPRKTEQIVDHVRRKWKLERCAICAGEDFAVFAQVTLRFLDDPNTLMSPNGVDRPSAAIVCTGCGHALVLDLLTAGVYRIRQPDPAPPTGPYR
jgi:hypothetical protein